MPDILIRGMEMPEGCLSCNLRATSGLDEWMCMVNQMRFPSWEDGWNGDKYRHVDCPLHELPEHGDLISRDEAVSVLQNIGSRDYRREKGTICDAIKMISHSQYVPTIVPASEEWKK